MEKILAEVNFCYRLTNENTVYRKYKMGNEFLNNDILT